VLFVTVLEQGKDVMNNTAILTPSYMKAELCANHLDSMLTTAPNADIFISVWQMDPQLPRYQRLLGEYVEIRDMREFGPAVNDLWKKHNTYEFFWMGSDDVFGTPGWLEKLLEKVNNDKISLLWPNDSLGAPHRPASEISRFPFTTRKVLYILGYFALPILRHYFIDDVWTALSKGVGREGYIADSVVEHRHTPAPQPGHIMIEDQRAFNRWNPDADIQKLREVMK